MGIFTKKIKAKTIFITVDIANVPGIFDYPKNVPLPRQGDILLIDGKGGKVKEVRHVLVEDLLQIKIITE